MRLLTEDVIFYWISALMIMNSALPLISIDKRMIIHLILFAAAMAALGNFIGTQPMHFPLFTQTHNMIRLQRVVMMGDKLKSAVRNGVISPENALSAKRQLIQAASSYIKKDNTALTLDALDKKKGEQNTMVPRVVQKTLPKPEFF